LKAALTDSMLALMLIGTYVHTPCKAKDPGEGGLSTQDLNQVPLLIGLAAAGAAVVFGVVVARRSPHAPTTSRASTVTQRQAVELLRAVAEGVRRGARPIPHRRGHWDQPSGMARIWRATSPGSSICT
jgi:hypothetical protein